MAVARVRNEGDVASGVARLVAALVDPEAFLVSVVGLVGCSASGKSTLCAALPANCADAVVACDDAYRPLADCPTFDLAEDVAWPGGEPPPAFEARGNADLNHPASVDWEAVEAKIDAAVDAIVDGRRDGEERAGVVLVDGLLLLGEGADRVRSRCAEIVLLDDAHDDEATQRDLARRKWRRGGHLGKKSYEDRGVSEDAYWAYWRDYVAPRWKAHGLDRAPQDATVLDCRAPVAESAAALAAVLRKAGPN
jgi:hypothetical protein